MKVRVWMILVLVAALLVTACSSGTKGSTPAKSQPTTPVAETGPKKGGIFKAALTTNPPTLDVMSTTIFSTRQHTFFFLEQLVTYDEAYKIVPLLAEKWEVSSDGKVYTFPLRKGVMFHNGKEMKAEDVIASANRFLEVSPRKGEFSALDKIVAKDDYTVEFHLKAPSGGFLPSMASPTSYMAIMPKEVIAGKGVGKLEVQDYIGTGPYQVVEWVPDKGMKLKRFDQYKPAASEMSGLAGERVAYFDEVHLIPVPEAGARVAGLESGEYDYAEALPLTEYDRLQENKKLQTFVHKPEWWILLEFNHSDAKFGGNLKFRQAIQAGLDMDGIMRAVTSGRTEFYRLQSSIFFNEQSWWTEEAKEYYNQKDFAKAKQLLAEAGYNGEEIVMLTNRDYDWMYKSVLAAADQMRKNLGMNVKVETLDWPGQRTKENNTEGWHITVTGNSLRFDGGDFSSSMHSKAKRKFYANANMDKLFERGAAATDFAERKQIYAQVQRLYYEDVNSIKLGDFHGLEAISSKVKGFRSWYTYRFWNVWKD